MIASSCFEAGAPFDLQIKARSLFDSRPRKRGHEIIIVCFPWCSQTNIKTQIAPPHHHHHHHHPIINHVKSRRGSWKLLQAARRRNTRWTFISSAERVAWIRGMRDYRLLRAESSHQDGLSFFAYQSGLRSRRTAAGGRHRDTNHKLTLGWAVLKVRLK